MPRSEFDEQLIRLSLLSGKYQTLRDYAAGAPAPNVHDFINQDRRTQYKDPFEVLEPGPNKTISRALAWLEHPRHHYICVRDPAFPPLLKVSNAYPIGLFVDGDPLKLWRPGIAVIGSRNPTSVGIDNTRTFVESLVARGLSIHSGLAHGIDSVAHRAALDLGAETVAFIGTGPDKVYPTAHADLQAQIAENGAVVTALLPGTEPRRSNFPVRNRIIAASSVGTLVMESAEGSGTLITAQASVALNRDVFAVPGSIHNPLYRGNNRLLREGSASLVQSADDVLEDLRFIVQRTWMDIVTLPAPLRQVFAERGYRPPLEIAPDDPDYYTLWEALDETPRDMGELADRTGLTFAKVSVMLMELELKKQISGRHGRYRHAVQPTTQ